MLSNSEVMMKVVHEAQVRQATAYSEHRYAARLAARAQAKEAKPNTSGWQVWKQLGASRRGNRAS